MNYSQSSEPLLKNMIIRLIGVLLIVLGANQTYTCLRVILVVVPYLLEDEQMVSAGMQVAGGNLIMALIGIAKIGSGVGLFWFKTWAKWVAVAVTIAHAIILSYIRITIWLQMANGTFENPADSHAWKGLGMITVNLAIAVMILICMKNPKVCSPYDRILNRKWTRMDANSKL